MLSWSPFSKSKSSSRRSSTASSTSSPSSSPTPSRSSSGRNSPVQPPSNNGSSSGPITGGTTVDDQINILFSTYTICPICSFVDEGKGLGKEHWKEAFIAKKKDDIWQIIRCSEHGDQHIKLCSNFDFYMKSLDYSPEVLDKPSAGFTLDVDELEKRMKNDGTIIENTPLMVDLDIYSDDQFIDDDTILKSIYGTFNLIPKEKNVVIRVNGKLAVDMVALNRKLNFVLSHVPDENPVVVELSFDRVVQLSKLNDTCILNPRIHPSIQIFVQKGIEKETAFELNNAFNALKQITNLTIIVRLVVSRPFPKLDSILNLLRFPMKGFCRFIIIEAERTPSQIMKQFRPQTIPFNEQDDAFNVDPLELLKLIEEDTKGQIKVEDFFPASVGMILEPFLSLLGKGNYNIRPSPFCGFATCLVNSENQQTYPSVPVTRLIDIGKLFKEIIPVIKGLTNNSGSNTNPEIGFFQYRSLKKAIEKCRRDQKDYPLPKDIFSYLTSKDIGVMKKTRTTIEELQFIIVHNVMDVGMLDILRRTRSSICRYQIEKGFISSSTNCI